MTGWAAAHTDRVPRGDRLGRDGPRRNRSRTGWLPVALALLALAVIWLLPSALSSQSDQPDVHPTVEPHGEAAAVPADGAPHESGSAAESDGEHPELPNLIHLIYKAAGGHAGTAPRWVATLYRFQDIVFALLAVLVLILIVRRATKQMQKVDAAPGRLQATVELFVESFHNLIVGILGPAGERYVPFLGSLFLYIWFMNLFGLIPLMKSPTSVLNTTAALAICVFLYVQWTGIRRLGPIGYLRHLAGDPHDIVGWSLVPLMLPLHIISEFAKPVSLALRLFGNILGEDVLMGVFAALGVAALAFVRLPVGVPLHVPFMLLALLMSTVQALVFTLLATIYIMQVLPHGDEEHAGE